MYLLLKYYEMASIYYWIDVDRSAGSKAAFSKCRAHRIFFFEKN